MAFLALSGPCKGSDWFDGIWVYDFRSVYPFAQRSLGNLGTPVRKYDKAFSHQDRVGHITHHISYGGVHASQIIIRLLCVITCLLVVCYRLFNCYVFSISVCRLLLIMNHVLHIIGRRSLVHRSVLSQDLCFSIIIVKQKLFI